MTAQVPKQYENTLQCKQTSANSALKKYTFGLIYMNKKLRGKLYILQRFLGIKDSIHEYSCILYQYMYYCIRI